MRAELVVTQHAGLVAYLLEQGLITKDTPILEHATAKDVHGKHVIGVLPMHLAAAASTVTEIPMALTPEDRGLDLPVERVRQIAGPPVTYLTFTQSAYEGWVRSLQTRSFHDGVAAAKERLLNTAFGDL